ncbi:hypothetical protein K2X40_02725 [Candidatus Babeliales bacterium]|nr:hypothetical protein [Candidatus Babeliales bacterium]
MFFKKLSLSLFLLLLVSGISDAMQPRRNPKRHCRGLSQTEQVSQVEPAVIDLSEDFDQEPVQEAESLLPVLTPLQELLAVRDEFSISFSPTLAINYPEVIGDAPASSSSSSSSSSRRSDSSGSSDALHFYNCLQQNEASAVSYNRSHRVSHRLHCGYYALFFAQSFVCQSDSEWPGAINNRSLLRSMIKPWEVLLSYKNNLGTFDIENIIEKSELLVQMPIEVIQHGLIDGWLEGQRFGLTTGLAKLVERFELGHKVAFIFNIGGHWITLGARKVDDNLTIYQFDSLNEDQNQLAVASQLRTFLRRFSSDLLFDLLKKR